MSQATADAHAPPTGVRYHPILPISTGKFAMWLFLATEIMFFTGLIGSYIVLRFGSKHWPTPYNYVVKTKKGERFIANRHPDSKKVDGVEHLVFSEENGTPHDIARDQIEDQDERGEKVSSLKETPLSLGLTAFNTFILICSSVTMVLALAAIQANELSWVRSKPGFPFLGFRGYMLLTILIGACFLSIQVKEYYALIYLDEFTPRTSIFASCFYVMTGCHGAHVTGGVLYNLGLFIAALKGRWNSSHAGSIELAGLYWHFVDLVWIILFTVVYLI
jgi:heme/copper-type cytochrome/quinol oxidase subunit 3